MPLSGSQVAYKQARAGIERAGASRAGYFTQTVKFTINGVDRASSIIVESLSVTLALNDEADDARFTMKPDATPPTVGQLITISYTGGVESFFAGQVVEVTKRRRLGNKSPFVDVRCTDWLSLFDRRLVNTRYQGGVSADQIAVNVIAEFTSGFTTEAVVSGLSAPLAYQAINTRPSEVLRDLCVLLPTGGFFYIDPNRRVHLWAGGTSETGRYARTPPATLTNTLPSLKSFTRITTGQDRRTRVIVEYGTTQMPRPGDIPGGSVSIPVTDTSRFDMGGGRVRIGSDRATYAGCSTPTEENNPAGAVIASDAAPVDTSLVVDDTTDIAATGTQWVTAGDQYIYFTGTSGGTTLTGIPASGFGSIAAPLLTDTPVSAVGTLYGISGLIHDQFADSDIVAFVQADDAGAQAAWAAIEGGDGIHEYVLSDSSLDIDTAADRAAFELASFADEVPEVQWTTTDMNALPGVLQVINLTVVDATSETLTITRVSLSFPQPNGPPMRACQASTVKRSTFLDVATQES